MEVSRKTVGATVLGLGLLAGLVANSYADPKIGYSNSNVTTSYKDSIEFSRHNPCGLWAEIATFIGQQRDAGLSAAHAERLASRFMEKAVAQHGIRGAMTGKYRKDNLNRLKRAVALEYTRAGRSCNPAEWGGVAAMQCSRMNYEDCLKQSHSYLQVNTCQAAWSGGMEGLPFMIAWADASKCFEPATKPAR